MRKIAVVAVIAIVGGWAFQLRAAETTGVSVYGFLVPSWSLGSEGVESFSQPNLSAPTAAANPMVGVKPTESRSSFQVAQSRFGFLIKPTNEATGRMEFDFIDFTKSTPTTAALPRVRRAVIEYEANPGLTIRLGQDWDLVSPLAPHSYNYVGHYFETGDIGFMRIQAQALLKTGQWEHAIALGMPGNNNSAADGILEMGLVPTIALRETFQGAAKSQYGASVLIATPKRDLTTDARLFAGALTGFASVPVGDTLEFHSEVYVGQNTNNLGMLGLAFGNAAAQETREAGAYVTAKKTFGNSAVFAGVGGAWILDPATMLASYTTSTGGVSSLAGTGPGIESNFTARIGYENKLTSNLLFFGELSTFFTRHHLLPADLGSVNPSRTAFVAQTGLQLSF